MPLTPPPLPYRLTLLLAAITALAAAAPLEAQSARRAIGSDTELLKEPSGTALARLGRGAPVLAGAIKGNWQEVTLEGWVIGNAMRDDKRDGFDVAVNLAVGTPIRAALGAGVTLGLARAGALFDRVEVKSGWIHVRRTGWVPKSAVEATAKAPAAAPPPPAPAKTVVAAPAPAPVPTPALSSSVTIAAGTALAAQAGGPPVGTLEAAVRGEVVEHRAGWSRVRIDAWVRDAAIGVSSAGGISAAEIRADPDKYLGQTVDWSLQVIAVQKADELRPELPLGQPYVLARGPLPETGFVYLLVKPEEAERFKVLAPLARVQVRATIRAGKSRFLPTPVLTFVRRLD